MKREASQRGIPDLKVGMLNYAWRDAYGEEAPGCLAIPKRLRTSEQIEPGNFDIGRYFDPADHLHADSTTLGGLPRNPRGHAGHEAYAAQWGTVAIVGLDAIMLRDSFGCRFLTSAPARGDLWRQPRNAFTRPPMR